MVYVFVVLLAMYSTEPQYCSTFFLWHSSRNTNYTFSLLWQYTVVIDNKTEYVLVDTVDSSSLYKLKACVGICGTISLVCINLNTNCTFIFLCSVLGLCYIHVCHHALRYDSTPHSFCFTV